MADDLTPTPTIAAAIPDQQRAANRVHLLRVSGELPVSDALARTLADNAIGLFIEWRDVHGDDEIAARVQAVRDVVEGATEPLDGPEPPADADTALTALLNEADLRVITTGFTGHGAEIEEQHDATHDEWLRAALHQWARNYPRDAEPAPAADGKGPVTREVLRDIAREALTTVHGIDDVDGRLPVITMSADGLNLRCKSERDAAAVSLALTDALIAYSMLGPDIFIAGALV